MIAFDIVLYYFYISFEVTTAIFAPASPPKVGAARTRSPAGTIVEPITCIKIGTMGGLFRGEVTIEMNRARLQGPG